MSTVWLATSGEYSDYRVQHVFAHEEDARGYPLADAVSERVLREGPVEVRAWHRIMWASWLPEGAGDGMRLDNPFESSALKDFDGREGHVEHAWIEVVRGLRLDIGGWNLERVRKTYSEQRAQHLARVHA